MLSSSYCPESWDETMSDIVTPSWNRIRNLGGIVCSPMTRTKTTWKRAPCLVDIAQVGTLYRWCGAYPNQVSTAYWGQGIWLAGNAPPDYFLGTTFLPQPALDLQRMSDVVITGAWAKAQTSEILAMATLAEAGKTVQSVTSILKRLFKIGRALKKGDFWTLRRELTPKQLADRWMEGRYAIRPLVYDMAGIFKALKAKMKPLRQTFRSGDSDQVTATQSGIQTYSSASFYGFGYGNVKACKSAIRTATARSGVLAAIESISQSSIWGLDQPFETIWELIPFSFVVDWFFNVGKTIAAWTPNPGIRGLASWVVIDDVTNYAIVCEGGTSTWGASNAVFDTFNVSGGLIQQTVHTRTRVCNPLLPIVPSLNLRLDAAKLLDLVIIGKRFFR